jgi:hypothetical protein
MPAHTRSDDFDDDDDAAAAFTEWVPWRDGETTITLAASKELNTKKVRRVDQAVKEVVRLETIEAARIKAEEAAAAASGDGNGQEVEKPKAAPPGSSLWARMSALRGTSSTLDETIPVRAGWFSRQTPESAPTTTRARPSVAATPKPSSTTPRNKSFAGSCM